MLTLSTHVLDTTLGLPASGVLVTLEIWANASWHTLGHGITSADGRVNDWGDVSLAADAMYCLTFQLKDYFSARGIAAFFPEIRLQFQADGKLPHLHVPLLLSPYGYSTYRGS